MSSITRLSLLVTLTKNCADFEATSAVVFNSSAISLRSEIVAKHFSKTYLNLIHFDRNYVLQQILIIKTFMANFARITIVEDRTDKMAN